MVSKNSNKTNSLIAQNSFNIDKNWYDVKKFGLQLLKWNLRVEAYLHAKCMLLVMTDSIRWLIIFSSNIKSNKSNKRFIFLLIWNYIMNVYSYFIYKLVINFHIVKINWFHSLINYLWLNTASFSYNSRSIQHLWWSLFYDHPARTWNTIIINFFVGNGCCLYELCIAEILYGVTLGYI